MSQVHFWTQAMGGVVYILGRYPTSADDLTLCGLYIASNNNSTFNKKEVSCKRCRRLLRMKDAHLWSCLERRRVAHGGRWRHHTRRLYDPSF